MDYIAGNKAAWEEAFDNRDRDWGVDVVERVRNETYPFLEDEMKKSLDAVGVRGKSVVQFCSNNGRELLSVVKHGAKDGVGFDIAENQVRFANQAAKDLALPCEFHARNILELGDEYDNRFDIGIITIGALCWFKDLMPFFGIVSRSLKPNGALLINEQHPVTNMLAAPGEENYLSDYPLNLCNSYFTKEWIDSGGIYYMTKKKYASKTFVSYSHSLSGILGALCANGLPITGFREFESDISGMFERVSNRGVPLSCIIESRKCV